VTKQLNPYCFLKRRNKSKSALARFDCWSKHTRIIGSLDVLRVAYIFGPPCTYEHCRKFAKKNWYWLCAHK